MHVAENGSKDFCGEVQEVNGGSAGLSLALSRAIRSDILTTHTALVNNAEFACHFYTLTLHFLLVLATQFPLSFPTCRPR